MNYSQPEPQILNLAPQTLHPEPCTITARLDPLISGYYPSDFKYFFSLLYYSHA